MIPKNIILGNIKRPIDILIRRCFFYCSNQDDAETNLKYHEIHLDKFVVFVK